MESNALEKSTNRRVASRFLAWTPKIWRIGRICDVVNRFLRKPFWFFPKNYFNFGFNTVELQSIVNLGPYLSKGYAPVVLDNSKVTCLGGRKDVALCPSIYCVLFIYGVAVSESWSSNFFFFHSSGGISSRPAAPLFLIFVNNTSSYSCVICPCLMSIWLLIIAVIRSSVILGDFWRTLMKCSFH